jgi:putative salt-induced outer membrane protein YdiY
MTANGSAIAERKGGKNEFTLGIEGNYGESEVVESDGQGDTVKNVENAKGYAKYRYLLTERNYAYLNGEVMYDSIADVDYRVTVGPGLGRYFVRSDADTLAGEFGVAWITDKVGDVEDDRVALRAAQNYEHKFGEKSRVWESVEYLPQADDFDNYLLNAEIGAEAMMNSRLSLRVVAQDKYNSTPAPGKEENDLSVTAGFGYKI